MTVEESEEDREAESEAAAIAATAARGGGAGRYDGGGAVGGFGGGGGGSDARDARAGISTAEIELPPPEAYDNEGGYAPPSCWDRFVYECGRPFFHVTEPDGRAIDLKRTFSPDPFLRTCSVKALFFLVSLEVLVQALVGEGDDSRYFFMAYLTHWGLVASLAYQLGAAVCAALGGQALRQPHGVGDRPRPLVRMVWGLFSLVAPAEIMIALLFWTLDYSGGAVTYGMAMQHGGVCLLLLIDGFLVSSIPLRARQLLFIQSFSVVYLTWSIVFAYSDMKNPSRDDDDAIYDTLRWRSSPGSSAILSLVCGVVMPPVIFFSCWMASLWSKCWRFDGSRRRLYHGHEPLPQFNSSEVEVHGLT